jgi:ribose 5-phosphate isomerase B|tara:strand:+ start:85 stop:555 length:471 start_codon:yes stop_codon:yes gene_type:complete
MVIYLGADHAGYNLKERLKPFLEEIGYEVKDMGAHELDKNDDYPDFVIPVAKAISENPQVKGIILGGGGQGEAIAANRFPNVRAMVYYGSTKLQEESKGNDAIRLGIEHNNSNILSLAARFLTEEEAKEAVRLWLETSFTEEERHKRRILKIDNIK